MLVRKIKQGHKLLIMLLVITVILAMGAVIFIKGVLQAEVQTIYYVSSDGSDLNPGTIALPFATINKARDVVKKINKKMKEDITIYIKSGEYYITSPVEFTDADSGTNGHNVIYKNYDGVGSAHFIGGKEVTGWTRYSGNIYRANVGKGWTFNTLYENGVRARKARYPNFVYDSKYPTAQAPYLYNEGVEGSHTELQYRQGDLDPSGWNLKDAQVVIWPGGGIAFRTHTIPIADINFGTRMITMTQPARYLIYDRSRISDGSRYYIQGVLDLLDQAGEFYLDTSEGYVYYWARDGAIEDQTIIAPKVTKIISITGSSESSTAHNIQFDGLTFECTEFTDYYRFGYNNDGDSGEKHAYPAYDRETLLPQHRTGAICLENTDNIAIKNCHIKNIGFTGIYMRYYNQNNMVYGNWIEHVGLIGVYLDGKYPGEGDVSKNNVLSNNLIHDVGELCGDSAGISIKNSGGNEISYSEIFRSPRYAVCWSVCYDIPGKDAYCRGNVMKYLKIYDCAQDSGDTAAIYAYGLSTNSKYKKDCNNTVEQVTVDNIYAHPSMQDMRPDGIYMDELTYGQTFKNVEVTNVQSCKYRDNDSGNHNLTNVNWYGSFDESLMDYANIGLKSDFQYKLPGTVATETKTR